MSFLSGCDRHLCRWSGGASALVVFVAGLLASRGRALRHLQLLLCRPRICTILIVARGQSPVAPLLLLPMGFGVIIVVRGTMV